MTIFLTLTLLFCAVNDFLHRKVFNWVLVLMMVVVAAAHVVSAMGWLALNPYASVADGSLAFIVAFIVSFIGWRFKLLGGGDVKLLAVLGFCFGVYALGPIVVLGTALTGAHALVLFLLRRFQTNYGFITIALGTTVPFGGWLALAAIGLMQWNLSL